MLQIAHSNSFCIQTMVETTAEIKSSVIYYQRELSIVVITNKQKYILHTVSK